MREGTFVSYWKVNLIVLWFGQFMVTSGMSMIMPFLPLYIKQLGITDPNANAMWTGILFAANFITAFLAQPIWGGIADRYGRKLMILRSGLGMSVVIICMGFASNVSQLLFLRLLNGTISGFIPASTTLISTNTPKQKIGFAMGVLQSGAVGGTILGPFIGGLLADVIGFRPIFYVTGSLVLMATILAAFLVKDKFDVQEAKSAPKVSIFVALKKMFMIDSLPALYAVTFTIQLGIMSSMPLMPLFIEQMHGPIPRLAFYAGLVGATTGLANMTASPILGRLGDRFKAEKILMICLVGASLSFIPQALVHHVWQLLIVRFILGMFMGGILPTVHALIRKHTPDGMESRSFSFNTSALALGNMLGSVFGGILFGIIGIRGIFIITSVLLLLNVIWVRKKLFMNDQHKCSEQEVNMSG